MMMSCDGSNHNPSYSRTAFAESPMRLKQRGRTIIEHKKNLCHDRTQ